MCACVHAARARGLGQLLGPQTGAHTTPYEYRYRHMQPLLCEYHSVLLDLLVVVVDLLDLRAVPVQYDL